MKELTIEEVNRRIDWMIKNMPFAPPPWATEELYKLIEKKKELENGAA